MTPIASCLLEGLPGVRHAFFTREGGVSRGVYESLNVGKGSKDDPAAVAENRRRAAAHLGQPPEHLLTCFQVHSPRALIADGPWGETALEGDGVVTARPGLVCGVLSADCAPVLIADPKARVVGACHAGWKGALGGVVADTVAEMESLGARPADMVAAVGPCIGPASYEVGLEFEERFVFAADANARFFTPGARPDKRMFDLPAYVLDRLRLAGVLHSHWTGHDTFADSRFFSNRRTVLQNGPDYGRLLSAIVLVGPAPSH